MSVPFVLEFRRRFKYKAWFPLGVDRRRSVKNSLFLCLILSRFSRHACDLRLMETSQMETPNGNTQLSLYLQFSAFSGHLSFMILWLDWRGASFPTTVAQSRLISETTVA